MDQNQSVMSVKCNGTELHGWKRVLAVSVGSILGIVITGIMLVCIPIVLLIGFGLVAAMLVLIPAFIILSMLIAPILMIVERIGGRR